MGCARGQGYLYGRPLSAPNVRRLLAEKRLLRVVDAPLPEGAKRRAG